MTSNSIIIFVLGGGLKCPRKTKFNTQCPLESFHMKSLMNKNAECIKNLLIVIVNYNVKSELFISFLTYDRNCKVAF
jgi:hypothetical protein